MSSPAPVPEKKAPTGNAMGLSRPKRPPRNAANDRASLALAHLILKVLNAVPESTARKMGLFVARMAWRIDKRHRKQILRHMDIAFRDEFSKAQKEAWCKANFEHVGLSIVEFARQNQVTPENMNQYVDLSEVQIMRDLLTEQNGKGILCVPAHHGNWELMGYTVPMLGLNLKSVARPLDNPLLNDLITQIREKSGHEIIHKWQVLWKLKKLLDKSNAITMSVDQNGGVGGTYIPMFGTLASTVTSPAELHLTTKAPIVVVSMNRQPDSLRHKLHVWEVIRHAKTGNHEADVKALLARINLAYERAIRAYPEQWLWVHKRWKTRPPGEQPGPDGLPPKA